MSQDAAWARAIKNSLSERLGNATGLPEQDVIFVQEYIEAGEWELALDQLCTQMDEYDIVPSREERKKLDELGAQLNVSVLRLLGDPDQAH